MRLKKIITGCVGLMACFSAFAGNTFLTAQHTLISSNNTGATTQSVYEVTINNHGETALNDLNLTVINNLNSLVHDGTDDIYLDTLAVGEEIKLNWAYSSMAPNTDDEPFVFYVTGTDELGSSINTHLNSHSNLPTE